MLALDARNGRVKWNVEIADAKRGYWSTNAPLVIRNHLIVGVSGDFDNLPGILKSFDAETGKPQWTFYSTPPPGTPGSISGGATGGQMWMTGTYDPELNLVYVGTGNPTPVLNGPSGRATTSGPAASSRSIPTPASWRGASRRRRTTRTTGTRRRCRCWSTATFNGGRRKLLLQASRNGYFFVLDRTTGKNLLTTPFAAVNWAKGVDSEGRPIPNPDKEPARDGRLVAPDEAGGTNYRSPSFDPATGLLIVSAQDAYGIYFFKPEHGDYGWAGADYNVYGRGYLRAIDYQTGKVRWSHDLSGGAGAAGVLTTASGLTFTGDSAATRWRCARATAPRCGTSIGRVGNSPITYELDGRQYVVMGGVACCSRSCCRSSRLLRRAAISRGGSQRARPRRTTAATPQPASGAPRFARRETDPSGSRVAHECCRRLARSIGSVSTTWRRARA